MNISLANIICMCIQGAMTFQTGIVFYSLGTSKIDVKQLLGKK